MSPQTQQHLTAAMEAEAFSFAKCSRFAAHARMNQDEELAVLFQNTADVDRCEHFDKEFISGKLLGSNSENLRAALDEKSRQIDMYARFRVDAVSDGDHQHAALFESIRLNEVRQLQAMEQYLQKLERLAALVA